MNLCIKSLTGVGGTTLTVNGASQYSSEKAWLTLKNNSGTQGTGGGISAAFSIPSYQAGVISSASLGSTTMRNVPDVSLNSDPDTGYLVIINSE